MHFLFAGLFAVSAGTTPLLAQPKRYSLDFDAGKYEPQTVTVNGNEISIRAFERIVYVANPVDTTYQILNIYIPEGYFHGETINGYTARSAPVFFPNRIGGYMAAQPATAINTPNGRPPGNGTPPQGPGGAPPNGMGMGGNRGPSAMALALSKGYVVASAGARGRMTKDAQGLFTGKSPAALVDLKAAIRYLKYNDEAMPGDANKIISNGTSAGGAMSSLLGATGNNKDYEPYLKDLGAAPANDDIFAVSAYCPITNLDNADAAYEWQFNGVNTYRRGGPMQGNNAAGAALTPEQITVSAQLKALFPAYLNSLQLTAPDGQRLSLDNSGNGSFKEYVNAYVIASAQKALGSGKDLSAHSWLTISGGKVTDLNFDAFVRYQERMKTPPAFDALDLGSPENQEFGTATVDKQHFTAFSASHSTVQAPRADEQFVRMLNPMHYIGTKGTQTAKYWRIRHGSKDKDTSLAIPVILATYLQNKGYTVNLELPWDRPHSGDYDLDELFQWVDQLCK
ncbi:subtype B tannase [Arsenicibacter rosenii]|nr:subtype B tannase [Arsenicibacter rosenii]